MSNALPSYDYAVSHSSMIPQWPAKTGQGYDGDAVYDRMLATLEGIIKQHGGWQRVAVKFYRNFEERAGTTNMDADDALEAFKAIRPNALNYGGCYEHVG